MAAPVARGVSSLLGQLKDGIKGLYPLLGLIVFTIIGALIFRELEGPLEEHDLQEMKDKMEKELKETIYKLNYKKAMTGRDAFNYTRKTILDFQEYVVDRNKSLLFNDVESQLKWTFWGSVFYCLTVYTTIGYGDIAPSTTPGRILTILYAFIGIPLTVICLYSLGLLFARFCRYIYHRCLKIFACCGKRVEKKVADAVGIEEGKKASDESEDDELLSFPISFLVVLTILWILFCAFVFTTFEETWDYGTSLYFTLISFTTIGFGDIVPTDYSYVVILAILILVGLSLVSTMLTVIQQQIQALAKGVQTNIDKEYMNALAEAQDDGEITEEDVKNLAEGDTGAVPEAKKNKLDAVVSRMPLKERMLFYAMSSSNKKQLEKNAEQKANRKTRSCQTDAVLLEALIKDELARLQLNRMRDFDDEPQPAPRLVSRGFKIEKVTPVEVLSNDGVRPVISTTVVREDEV